MNYTLIETNSGLAALLDRFSDSDAVVVDTEFMRRDTFYPQAALYQLCFPGQPDTAWLIDPLAVDDMTPLGALLEEEATLKVLHSCSEDLEVFQRHLGCLPAPLFDTQRAAALLGLGFGLGYRRLVDMLTGEELDKDETRSDWLKRPLSDAQLAYAAADVLPLLPVYRQLHSRLEAAGRLAWVLEDGAAAVAAAREPAPPAYLKIKSAWKLSPRQLAVLRAVCEWREARSQALDKPRGWILSDKLCLAVAQHSPRTESQLRQLPDMPAALVRKQGEVLLNLVADAQALDDSELPEPLARPLDAGQRKLVKRLKQAIADLGRDWQVDPEVLLTGKDFELMARVGRGESVDIPPRWDGWRRDSVIDPLLAIVEGEH